MGRIESGRSLFRAGIPRILGQCLQHDTCPSQHSTQHRAGIVERLGIGIADLQSQTGARGILADAGLQGMICGVRTAGHHQLRPKTSSGLSRRIELSEGREGGIGAAVTVRRIDAGQMHAGGAHVRGAELHISEIVVDARGVALDVTVAEILGEANHSEQLDLVSRSQRL